MAKKKDSKVSITKVDAFLKTLNSAPVPVSVEINEAVLEFEVNPLLSLADFHAMVHAVADASFAVDEEVGLEQYDAVYHAYAENIAILTYVANFKADMASEKLYALSQCTEIMNVIRHNWNSEQQFQYETAVAEQIEFKQKELLSVERKMLQDATGQIEAATNSFVQFTSLFENIDSQEMMASMQKIANMNEQELGHAVVTARDADFVDERRAELQVLK